MRLDSVQHEGLIMDLDPELVLQHVAMKQTKSENDFQNSLEEQSNDSNASTPRLLSPPQNSKGNGQGSFRRARDRSPSPSPYLRHKSVPSMSASPALTPRTPRKSFIDDADMQSIEGSYSSSYTDNSSPTNSTCDTVISMGRGRSEKVTKKDTANVTTQILPYVHEAFEIATGRLGNGTNLRKVSVVKQPTTGNDKTIFGFKKNSKREDSQTAFVFSFGRDEWNQTRNESSTDFQDYSRQTSNSTLNEIIAPKISISHVDFPIDEDDDKRYLGKPLQRYDSDATLTSELARQNDPSTLVKRPSVHEAHPYGFLEATSDSQDPEMIRRVSTSSVRKRSNQDQIQLQLPQSLSAHMLSPRPIASDNISVRSFRSQGSGGKQSNGDPLDSPHVLKSDKERGRDNVQRFWDYWTMVSSIIYAIAILVTAIMFYSLDLFVFKEGTEKSQDLSEYYNILLILGGAVWLVWLMVDINKYTNMITKYCSEEAGDLPPFTLEEVNGELLISIPITTAPKKIPQYYCFSKGRHSGSFFLKAGATFFCLGHIIHILLNLAKQFIFLSEEDVGNIPCGNWPRIIFQILQPIYVLLQLYMMYKYSNVIVNRSKGTARFAFMHCIATSLVFWVYTLIQETIDYIVKKDFGLDNSDCVESDSVTKQWFEDLKEDFIQCKTKCTSNSENSTLFEFSIDCVVSQLCNCNKNNEVGKLIFEYGDYLYPFSIEFSILIVGVWYMMWSNIGKVEEYKDDMEFLPSPRRSFDSGTGNPTNEALYIYADCHSSVKGIFLGMCHVTLCITGTIVYIIFLSSGGEYCKSFRVTNDVIECLLLISTIAASIWVYLKIAHLDVNPHPISFLDDLLLFICIPAFFLYAYFSAIPAIAYGDQPGNIVTNVLMLVQVLIQTPMIVDGLRRCCDRQENQRLKPGRNLVTFLLIANLSLYFWDTMEAKSDGYGVTQKKFYGVYLWTIAKHTTLPLCIFYRFHSSVALADIWNSAYRPGDHH